MSRRWPGSSAGIACDWHGLRVAAQEKLGAAVSGGACDLVSLGQVHAAAWDAARAQYLDSCTHVAPSTSAKVLR